MRASKSIRCNHVYKEVVVYLLWPLETLTRHSESSLLYRVAFPVEYCVYVFINRENSGWSEVKHFKRFDTVKLNWFNL